MRRQLYIYSLVVIAIAATLFYSNNIEYFRALGSDYYDSDSAIHVMNADGSGLKRLTEFGDVGDPKWSPDGSKIAFAYKSKHDPDDSDLYVMNADGSHRKRLTDIGYVYYWVEWSPDGSKIVFAGKTGGNRNIYIIDADGSNLKRLTSSTTNDTDFNFSPDGSKIAFISDRSGENELYIMNPNGTEITQITDVATYSEDSLNANFAIWSPQSDKLLFTVTLGERGTNGTKTSVTGRSLYVVNADKTNLTLLTDNFDYFGGGWSPDGTKVLFGVRDMSEEGIRSDLYISNSDGSNLTSLVSSDERIMNAKWSPDGSKISFQQRNRSSSSYSTDIYVIGADGSGQLNLTNSADLMQSDDMPGVWHITNQIAQWSLGSDRIVFYSNMNDHSYNDIDNNDIYVVNMDGSGLTRLTHPYRSNYSNVNGTWSPDGSKIVFVTSRYAPRNW